MTQKAKCNHPRSKVLIGSSVTGRGNGTETWECLCGAVRKCMFTIVRDRVVRSKFSRWHVPAPGATHAR